MYIYEHTHIHMNRQGRGEWDGGVVFEGGSHDETLPTPTCPRHQGVCCVFVCPYLCVCVEFFAVIVLKVKTQ